MDRRSEGVAKRLSSRKISAPKQFVAGPASSRVNESYFPCNFQVKSALDRRRRRVLHPRRLLLFQLQRFLKTLTSRLGTVCITLNSKLVLFELLQSMKLRGPPNRGFVTSLLLQWIRISLWRRTSSEAMTQISSSFARHLLKMLALARKTSTHRSMKNNRLISIRCR